MKYSKLFKLKNVKVNNVYKWDHLRTQKEVLGVVMLLGHNDINTSNFFIGSTLQILSLNICMVTQKIRREGKRASTELKGYWDMCVV